jgi:integrase
MPRSPPYLQRRGYGLTFRISVPPDLRNLVGEREITKALPTANRPQAIPMVLKYAACAKRMFYELRAGMAANSIDPTEDDLRAAIDAIESDERRQKAQRDSLLAIVSNAKQKIARDLLGDQHEDELDNQRMQFLRQLKEARLEGENEAMRRVLARYSPPALAIQPPVTESQPAVMQTLPSPMFSTVIEGFLSNYNKRNKHAMFKKHAPVLSMLLEVVGDKQITSLKQRDINEFFELLGNLPPRWKDTCRKLKLTVRELAELDHTITLGPKSFDDTYIACMRPFLKSAKKDWQDQGFPLGLSIEGIEYLGDREEGESKQRSFNQVELKRLFEGPEMKAFADDPKHAHRYWLPTIGLFTGARVNEICQINPQTDIARDPDSGKHYLWITKETESDSRIRKSVKTGDSRKVPIHKQLLELGFLDYVSGLKSKGVKLLFPEWEPINRRASGEAEKWFRQFLRDTRLRDETPKAKILGMHAFRHTLLTYGAMQKPPLSLFCITGHAQEEAPIHATGAGKGYLTLSLLSPLADRADLLNQLDYGLSFHKPVTP